MHPAILSFSRDTVTAALSVCRVVYRAGKDAMKDPLVTEFHGFGHQRQVTELLRKGPTEPVPLMIYFIDRPNRR